MKKTLFTLFTALTSFAFAQNKDLAVTWLQPDSGFVMTSGDDFRVKAYIKNAGTDAIEPEDMIYCGLLLPGINGGGPLPVTFDIISHGEIAPGDSIFYEKTDYRITLSQKQIDSVNMAGGMMCYGVVFEDAGGTDTDPVFENDFSCQFVQLRLPATTGFRELAGSQKGSYVFPNPAQDEIRFRTSNTQAGKVTVYDLTGKQLLQSGILNGEASINIASLNNGIYLYTVVTAEGEVASGSGKFAVSR